MLQINPFLDCTVYSGIVVHIGRNSHEPDESFFSLIQKGSAREVAAPQNNGIDFYFFDRSYDVDGFLGNNNFNALWLIKNTNSFIESKLLNPGNYWIGVKNPSSMYGLKAIVEVVAFGNF